jgi:hypothetical protein
VSLFTPHGCLQEVQAVTREEPAETPMVSFVRRCHVCHRISLYAMQLSQRQATEVTMADKKPVSGAAAAMKSRWVGVCLVVVGVWF